MPNQNKIEKTILVTGGAGFVGSHCVLKLLENDYNVVVIDNLTNCYKDNKKSHPESLIRVQILAGRRIDFFPVDLTNKDELDNLFSKYNFHCVMHFAALKSVSESCQMPLMYYQNNIIGTINVLEVMKKFNCKLFVYSSSSTVYGIPLFLPLTEKHPTGQGCTNPYGKSKYFVEEILKDTCISDENWKVISLRYFNPVGAHESGKIGEDPSGIPNNLMPYISQVAIGKRPQLYIYGNDYDTPDGTGIRDYIHIQDLADGHLAALNKLFCPKMFGFKAYNLGTGTGYSVLEVVKAFSEASGKEILYKIVGRREGDVSSSYCDTNLAKVELNWTAKKDLHEMCQDMWRWQLMNPNGYQKTDLDSNL